MRTIFIVTIVTLCPTAFVGLSVPPPSWAHGFAGKRFFPTTLSIEDPFVADELSFLFNFIKEPGEAGEPPAKSTEFSVEYSKRITPRLGVSIGDNYRFLDPDEGGNRHGFGNLEAGAKYQFFTSALHETILSIGIETEIEDTGDTSVGAEEFTTISPAFFFGKGFSDLPESLKYLRPLAITGVIGPNVPTRGTDVTAARNEETGEIEREVERHPVTLIYGFSLQYSFQYLESYVRDVGLGVPFNRMILLVEVPFETGLNRGSGGDTAGFVNPGLIWIGSHIQLGIELQVPVNDQTAEHVGVLGLVHFFIDDLFPNSLGRPFFR